MAYLPDTAVDLLRELVIGQRVMAAELRALRRATEALTAGIAPDEAEALVLAVYAVAGNREFRSSELIGMSHRSDRPERLLRQLLGARNAVAVGLLLADVAGKVCADTGLVLIAAGKDRGVKTWRVSPTPTPANR